MFSALLYLVTWLMRTDQEPGFILPPFDLGD